MGADIKTTAVAALANAEMLLRRWFPAGKISGKDYCIGGIDGHEGSSLKINLHTGLWADFGGNLSGIDLVALYAAHRNIDNGQAANEIAEQLGHRIHDKPPPSPKNKRTPIPCESEDQPDTPPNFKHFEYGTPAKVFAYKNSKGLPDFYVCRFILDDGSKQTWPMSRCLDEKTGKIEWRWKAPAKPSSLYNLPDILADQKSVIVVEGEKCADALKAMFPGSTVTCWQGGTNRLDWCDLSPLEGRNVVFWPDNDEPGFKVAAKFAERFPSAKFVKIPEGKPDGWDVADAIQHDKFTSDQVKGLIVSAGALPEEKPHDSEDGPPLEYYDQIDAEELPVSEEPSESAHELWPFKLLGYDRGEFFYYPIATKQVISLTPSAHVKLPLLQLAPYGWWEKHFGGDDSGPNWTQIAGTLMREQARVGKYNANKIRGRGCWIDRGRVFYHAGTRCFVDGVETELSALDTQYVYEIGDPLSIDAATPATNTDARKLIDLCEMISIKHPIYAKLLAGWCVIAPICGAFGWRPHIWINGPAQSGKTWTLSNIVAPLVARSGIMVQSATTEAGLRQKLRCDALPVIFDEAESEDRRGMERMKGILELARQASSESGAVIAKGSATGKSVEFLIRSAFCFSSIGVAAQQKADTSRITSIELTRPKVDGPGHFEKIKKFREKTTGDPIFNASIRARSLQLAATISANAEKFTHAIAQKLGDQRAGDQLGPMIAGAFSLTSAKLIDLEFAQKWVEKQTWTGFETDMQSLDEIMCLQRLLEAQVIVDTEERNRFRTISELIETATSPTGDSDDAKEAKEALERVGVSVSTNHFAVSDNHSGVAKIYAESQWAGKWKDQLRRIEGAEQSKSVRFAGISQRATKIPLENIG